MKKIFITLILSIIWLIGFSSAQFMKDDIFNFSYNWSSFSPSTLTTSDISKMNFSYNWSDGCVVLFNKWNWRCRVYFNWYWNWSVRNECNVNMGGTFNLQLDVGTCNWVVKVSTRSTYLPIDVTTPILTWLTTVFNELIPYVVYIWLWILVVTIWFVAIKWLMLWIYNKVKFIFKK